MNSNFVNTEPIFKIQNSAESYCLAELPFSFPKFPLKIVQNYFLGKPALDHPWGVGGVSVKS